MQQFKKLKISKGLELEIVLVKSSIQAYPMWDQFTNAVVRVNKHMDLIANGIMISERLCLAPLLDEEANLSDLNINFEYFYDENFRFDPKGVLTKIPSFKPVLGLYEIAPANEQQVDFLDKITPIRVSYKSIKAKIKCTLLFYSEQIPVLQIKQDSIIVRPNKAHFSIAPLLDSSCKGCPVFNENFEYLGAYFPGEKSSCVSCHVITDAIMPFIEPNQDQNIHEPTTHKMKQAKYQLDSFDTSQQHQTIESPNFSHIRQSTKGKKLIEDSYSFESQKVDQELQMVSLKDLQPIQDYKSYIYSIDQSREYLIQYNMDQNSAKQFPISISDGFALANTPYGLVITGSVGQPRGALLLHQGRFYKIQNLKSDHSYHTMQWFGKYIWVIGGEDNKRVEIQNPSSGIWQSTHDLPKPIQFSTSAVSANRLFLCGGYERNTGKYLDTIYMYNSKGWELLLIKIPLKLLYPGIFVIGKYDIIIFGGIKKDESLNKQSFTLNLNGQLVKRFRDIPHRAKFDSSTSGKQGDVYYIMPKSNKILTYNSQDKQFSGISLQSE